MQAILGFLVHWGYFLLGLAVFAEQAGLPVPALPVLLAMGALVGTGRASLSICVLISICASLAGDYIWYELGRRKGHSILNLLCRVSLEPDSCVSATKQRWDRFGGKTLIFAKFVPGLSTVATPLAGLMHMEPHRFLLLDTLGALAWSGCYLAIGMLFANQLELAADLVQKFGTSMAVLVTTILIGYLAWKYYNRQRFIRELRVARISPEELSQLILDDCDVSIVDLRSHAEASSDGLRLPRAVWLDPGNLGALEERIPKDKEVVLYCS